MKRASGILLPLSSLPSDYGIGTLGKAAFSFIDFLVDAGQTWWQVLPVGPTSIGDSPYQSPSAYAGNPYFIDLDLLQEDGLLTKAELHSVNWGKDPLAVDYGTLYKERLPLLRKAMERGYARDREKVNAFAAENAAWIYDYALFMALKQHFQMVSWLEWPDEDIRLRRPDAVARYRELLQEDVSFFIYVQYLFFAQWARVRDYAREKGIRILGDMALYVALDSADVWASPENFLLDEKNVPTEVAGVPPDYFSKTGQLWGNPLYNYDHMKRDGFGFFIRRIDGMSKLYDAIRIDHFRGLASFWAVPYGDDTAKRGRWVEGPGMQLVQVLKDWFPNLSFIAEDLGSPSEDVTKLLADSGFPGMRVLEFAFSAKEASSYLPHAHVPHCVCYTGTHDNAPLLGWREDLAKADLKKAESYLGLNEDEGFVWGILRGGMSSVANLFIAQMQDYLELGNASRMNTPGTLYGNWTWRLSKKDLSPKLAKRIREITLLYGRCESPAIKAKTVTEP